MSSLHLLRILGVMLMTVSWFLCAWTVGVLQNRDRNIPVFIMTTTSDGQGFNLCYLDRWDYMMAVGEWTPWSQTLVQSFTVFYCFLMINSKLNIGQVYGKDQRGHSEPQIISSGLTRHIQRWSHGN